MEQQRRGVAPPRGCVRGRTLLRRGVAFRPRLLRRHGEPDVPVRAAGPPRRGGTLGLPGGPASRGGVGGGWERPPPPWVPRIHVGDPTVLTSADGGSKPRPEINRTE